VISPFSHASVSHPPHAEAGSRSDASSFSQSATRVCAVQDIVRVFITSAGGV
jgi:hypothetical protein